MRRGKAVGLGAANARAPTGGSGAPTAAAGGPPGSPPRRAAGWAGRASAPRGLGWRRRGPDPPWRRQEERERRPAQQLAQRGRGDEARGGELGHRAARAAVAAPLEREVRLKQLAQHLN